MKHHNLKDPKVVDTPRRVRSIETMSPIGFSSVERGGLRIASDQGLLIEGQGLVSGLFDVTGTLSGSGDMDWSGDADFTGSVRANYFVVDGPNSYTQLNDAGFAFIKKLSGGSEAFAVTMSPNNGTSFNEGDIKMGALDVATSPGSMRLVVIDSNSKLWKGPVVGSGGGPGGGTDPGGGGDNPKGLIYPYPLNQAGDRFGWRDYPPSPWHRGIDWPKPHGTPIPACGDGTVIMAQDTGDLWGNYIRIDHGDGVWTAYAHLHYGGIYVSVGDTVTRGQIIGGVGTTGPSTGNHLHFEVWVDGERIDPEIYIGAE